MTPNKDWQSIQKWLESLPNTQNQDMLDFFKIMKTAHQEKLAIGIQANFGNDGGFSFDCPKINNKTLKRLFNSFDCVRV